MQKTQGLLWLMIIAALVAAGCGERTDTDKAATPAADHTADAATATSGSTPPAAAGAGLHGTIVETMDAGGYTYVQLDTGRGKLWAAGPLTEGLAVGQELTVAPGMLMTDFTSKALDRTFAEIHFVDAFTAPAGAPAGAPVGAPAGHGGMGGQALTTGTGVDGPISGTRTVLEDAHVQGVLKADGGYTVAEIHDRCDDLAGKTVRVRGRVVKFTPNVMGINWIHIQDGTGSGANHDLTVTSHATAEVGDVVLVEGPLSVDRDFGAGYRYPVIIEGAEITVE